MQRIVIAVLSMLILSINGCAKKPAVTPPVVKEGHAIDEKSDELVATIGSDKITLKEYLKEFSSLPPAYRTIAGSNRDKFLESLINRQLLLGEAKRRGLEDIENVKKMLERAKEEIMIQELIGEEISDKIKITDDEIKEYYEKNKERFLEPARIRASHILLDSEAMAKKVLQDISEGKDFTELAKEYSLDAPTKDNGGDVGYFSAGMLLPEFEEACDKLNVGGISGAVKSGLGYHVIKVTEKKDAGSRPLDDVKNDIENELFIEKQTALYDGLIQKLKGGKDIKIYNKTLESLEQPAN